MVSISGPTSLTPSTFPQPPDMNFENRPEIGEKVQTVAKFPESSPSLSWGQRIVKWLRSVLEGIRKFACYCLKIEYKPLENLPKEKEPVLAAVNTIVVPETPVESNALDLPPPPPTPPPAPPTPPPAPAFREVTFKKIASAEASPLASSSKTIIPGGSLSFLDELKQKFSKGQIKLGASAGSNLTPFRASTMSEVELAVAERRKQLEKKT